MNNAPTQKELILQHLKEGSAITPLKALNYFGCLRLAAVIHELKRAGYQIESKRITTKAGKSIAEYRIIGA